MPARDVAGTAGHLTLTLPAAVTAALLTRVAAAFHGGIERGAADRACGCGCGLVPAARPARRGDAVLLELEGHGREEAGFAEVDLSRTVGWFTSLFPVRLDWAGLMLRRRWRAGCAGPCAQARQGAVAGAAGQGSGLWAAALSERGDGAASLAGLRRRRSASTTWAGLRRAGGGLAALPDEAVRLGGSDPAMPLSHVRRGQRADAGRAGGPRLSAHWTFAPALLPEALVRELAEGWFGALAALVRHAAQAGAGGRSPSDLPLVALTQGEIERLERAYPRLEDVLPLSPLQEGLLFHALYDAQAPDVYTVQLELELAGALDAAALRAAVQALLERHASLRAGFCYEHLSRPVQVMVARCAGAVAAARPVGACEAERERRLAETAGGGPGGAVRAGRAAAAAVCC